MNHFINRHSVTSGVVGAFALAASILPSAAAAAAPGGETLANARNATAIYTDAGAAPAAGYELLTDAAGIACIDQAGEGAMGVHFVKGALVQSGTLDPARPQALVYEVGSSGRLELAALEYVVIQSAWDAGHSGPPTLFGQKFMLNPADNRFGLPAFYSLHAWVWKHNPKGTFEPWNPDVHCANGSTANGASPDEDSAPEPMPGM
ncbi:MAG: hypothetical protein JOZ81_06515 [Chloroflexi bacterium]|nr:hypothetical protein [Chloroflexota bacterium]